jgi:hypothetical protein
MRLVIVIDRYGYRYAQNFKHFVQIQVWTSQQSIASASKRFRPPTDERLWRPLARSSLERRPRSVRPPSRPRRWRALQPRFRGFLQIRISSILSASTTLKSKPSNPEFSDTPWQAFNLTQGNKTSIVGDKDSKLFTCSQCFMTS